MTMVLASSCKIQLRKLRLQVSPASRKWGESQLRLASINSGVACSQAMGLPVSDISSTERISAVPSFIGSIANISSCARYGKACAATLSRCRRAMKFWPQAMP